MIHNETYFFADAFAAADAIADGGDGWSPDYMIRGEWIVGGVVKSLTLDPDRNADEQTKAWFLSLDRDTRRAVSDMLAAGVYGIGSWRDRRGRIVLDVCDTEVRGCDALAKAKHRGEEAIWHPDHGEMEV